MWKPLFRKSNPNWKKAVAISRIQSRFIFRQSALHTHTKQTKKTNKLNKQTNNKIKPTHAQSFHWHLRIRATDWTVAEKAIWKVFCTFLLRCLLLLVSVHAGWHWVNSNPTSSSQISCSRAPHSVMPNVEQLQSILRHLPQLMNNGACRKQPSLCCSRHRQAGNHSS